MIFVRQNYFTGNEGYQNFPVFASMLRSLILDSNEKVLSYEKSELYHSNLEQTMFNLASYRVNLTFNNFVLVPKIFSSLYSNSILNLYLFHELNTWSRNPTNNISLKNCLFGTVKLTRSGGKSKFDDNARGIAFDGKGSW